MKRALLAILAAALILPLASTRVGAQATSLKFFKRHFITGDYVVAGTSLWRRGDGVAKASGTITVPVGNLPGQVPVGVDILAAYLYVQTTEAATPQGQWSGIHHAKFNGFDLGPGANSFAKALNWEQATRPCWSLAFPGARRLVTYRTDVLRFLPLGPPDNPEHVLTGPMTIEVPDSGLSFPDLDELAQENPAFTGPRAVGASLVVLYRDPSKPLRSVVIYDGGVTKQAFETMGLTISGFDQASMTPGARLTPIVGDGRPFLSERLKVNGQLVATNPFRSAAGAKWDNPTYDVTVAPGSANAGLEISPDGLLSDCVSLSAVAFSTQVQDSDNDGLLDRWESATSPGQVLDPYNRPQPGLALGAMGASPTTKDLFIEIGYLDTDYLPASTGPGVPAGDGVLDPMTYGGVPKPAHSHKPGHEALKLMGDALWNAPLAAQRIRVHFDVGAGYDGGSIPDCVAGGTPAGACIVRGSFARGGEVIDESFTQCTPGEGAPPWECQFEDYPGTVGWKTGFQYMRDQILSRPALPDPIPPGFVDPCDDPSSTGYTSCVRRFDPDRINTFHYALFAHAVGLPVSDVPCVDGDVNEDDQCLAGVNPNFLVPRTNTGLGDFPGGDFLVSMGAFNDEADKPVATVFEQASTLTHEFGHNAERRHGGEAFEPNCRPTYLSVMNYMYQLRGLSDTAGNQFIDFSREVGAALNEDALASLGTGDPTSAFKRYRLGWFAPLAGSYLAGQAGVKTAQAHCNGSPLLPGEAPYVRIDARRADLTGGAATNFPIDWDADNNPATVVTTQDINFSGALGQQYPAATATSDWEKLDLRQVGSRRSSGGTYTDTDGSLALGPLSILSGKGDAGKGDAGKGDAGKGDAGKGDAGKGDAGKGDAGGAEGKGDAGKGDAGGGDMFDSTNPALFNGEMTKPISEAIGGDVASTFSACVVGVDCDEPEPLNNVILDWTPGGGDITQYIVYRVPGTEIGPANLWVEVGTVPSTAALLQLIDDGDELIDGQPYTYFVTAGTPAAPGLPSNAVTIFAVNPAPVAVDDPGEGSYGVLEEQLLEVGELNSTDRTGVLVNDSPDSTSVELFSGPSHGTLNLRANGSFVYLPHANYNGPDSFQYRSRDGVAPSVLPATVRITVNPVNDGTTISNIADQTINANTSTAALPFTIVDLDDPTATTLTVSGNSSNLTLVPIANIVFGGSGPNRTVTVTPAANQIGTATITVTVTDPANPTPTVSDTFLLTVNSVGYELVNVKNLPPSGTYKPGSLIEFKWKFKEGGVVVASSNAKPSITITGTTTSYNLVVTPENCTIFGLLFWYNPGDKTWQLIWKAPHLKQDTYKVVVKSMKTGQSFPSPSSQPPWFPVVVKN